MDDPAVRGLGAPAKFSGSLEYYEICQKVKKGALTHWYERAQRSCYGYKDTEWISYEDAPSVKEKGIFINANFLGGAMIQAMDYDDYSNICGDGNYHELCHLSKFTLSILFIRFFPANYKHLQGTQFYNCKLNHD